MTSGRSYASQEQVGPQVWAAHKLKASHKVTDTHTAPPQHTPQRFMARGNYLKFTFQCP